MTTREKAELADGILHAARVAWRWAAQGGNESGWDRARCLRSARNLSMMSEEVRKWASE